MQLLDKLDELWFVFLKTTLTEENSVHHNRLARKHIFKSVKLQDDQKNVCDSAHICEWLRNSDTNFLPSTISLVSQQALLHSEN